MDTSIEALGRRVARLQRSNRRYFVGLVLVAAGVIMAMSADGGTVRGSAFELVDEEGRVRAALKLEDGQPLMVFSDAEGQERMQLFHGNEATGVYVLDEAGTPRIGIAQFAHGGGGVALHGPESKGAAVLYLKGSGSLRFFDTEGKLTLSVPGADRAPENSGSDQ